ncbi:MAG: A circularly permuted ATPgrasp family protein, partial [Betaproteobacteria bacterium]|nr:A circularly permuted ATPgrasp family protein [Betaproteobacteria bacterium]
LTAGPWSETYFEHAYLAAYLGLPLVTGSDLIVQGDKLYLKTLQGLQRLHGLLRRIDDELLDPLELRPDSSLGVPGLIHVLRAKALVLANAPGSGFLESPAVQGFLPAIAKRLLGEDLN